MTDAATFREFERRTQDRGAASYTVFFEPITSAVTDDLLDAAGVRAGVRLLDIATGPGTAAARAATRGAHAIGVDLSTEMLAQARARHPGIAFREADAEALPFPDDSFDAVVCSFGIGHFPNPENATREMRRVLTAGGRAAVCWWSLPHGAQVNGTFLDALAEAQITPPPDLPVAPPITRYSDPANLQRLLAEAGLDDIAIREVTWTSSIPDTETWWRGGLQSLVRIAVIILAQPPETQDRVRNVFDRFAERFRVGDGFVVPMAAKIASGRKHGGT